MKHSLLIVSSTIGIIALTYLLCCEGWFFQLLGGCCIMVLRHDQLTTPSTINDLWWLPCEFVTLLGPNAPPKGRDRSRWKDSQAVVKVSDVAKVWENMSLIENKVRQPRTRICGALLAQLAMPLGLTTVPYTATAAQNTALYGCALYRNKAVLTKSWLVTVRWRLQTAVLRCFTGIRIEYFF